MAGRRPRSERDARRRAHGQNFLHSQALARELIADAGVGRLDLVVEIGAGSGTLTEALARVARSVVAIEVDPTWASRLRERFAGNRQVTVVEADALTAALPHEGFRIFGSVPFGRTTAILRRILDDRHLTRADLVVQWEAGYKRILLPPRNALTIEWSPWWTFAVTRRISAVLFRPVPSVDAALLSIERRPEPLLDRSQRERFVALVREGFHRPQVPLARALRQQQSEGSVRRALEREGASGGATAPDLSARQWIGLYRLLRS